MRGDGVSAAGAWEDPDWHPAIDEYTHVCRIGGGAMGEVHKYFGFGHFVAVKVLHRMHELDPARVALFKREACALGAMDARGRECEHIVRLLHMGRYDGVYCMLMEYVDGETLSARLLRVGRMSASEASEVLVQLTRGLQFAHGERIIHRDVKPSNIMLTRPFGRLVVKLLDFGVALLQEESTGSRERVVGTIPYAAPEQLRGGEVTWAADQFSLGCVLFEMLTGERLFRSATPDDRRTEFPDLSRLERCLPGEAGRVFDAVIRRCIALDPSDRYESLEALRAEVRASFPSEDERELLVPEQRLGGGIPASPTGFEGRVSLLRTVTDRVMSSTLVTLTGPGGIGKTRVAQEVGRRVASRLEGGVWYVDLSGVQDEEGVAREVARRVDPRGDAGRPAEARIESALGLRPGLLILDNAEDGIAACAGLAEMLGRTIPALRVLVTSRERLLLSWEHEIVVPGMELPPSGPGVTPEAVASSESVRLLASRARQHLDGGLMVTRSNAADVARLVRLLDGIPLAIELAAARLGSMEVRELADRLEWDLRQIDLPGNGRNDRTMTGVLRSSVARLGEAEAALLREITVFRGGFDLHAAEVVAVDPSDPVRGAEVSLLLHELVHRSLLTVRRDGLRIRYTMPGVLRVYLRSVGGGSVPGAATHRRHLRWMRGLAAGAFAAQHRTEQVDRFDRLEAEVDNARAALAWGEANDPEGAAGLAVDLHRFWLVRGMLDEGRSWLERLTATAAGGDVVARGRMLNALGILRMEQHDHAAAAEALRASLEIWRQLGDRPREASLLQNLGILFDYRDEIGTARSFFLEATGIYRACPEAFPRREDARDGEMRATLNLGSAERKHGDLEEALRLARLARAHFEASGNSHLASIAMLNEVSSLVALGRHDDASPLLGGCARSLRQLWLVREVPIFLCELAEIAFAFALPGCAARAILLDRFVRRLPDVKAEAGHDDRLARVLADRVIRRLVDGGSVCPRTDARAIWDEVVHLADTIVLGDDLTHDRAVMGGTALADESGPSRDGEDDAAA